MTTENPTVFLFSNSRKTELNCKTNVQALNLCESYPRNPSTTPPSFTKPRQLTMDVHICLAYYKACRWVFLIMVISEINTTKLLKHIYSNNVNFSKIENVIFLQWCNGWVGWWMVCVCVCIVLVELLAYSDK